MKKILARLVTVAVVLLAFVLGWFAWEHYTRAPWTRDARVRADVVTLSADVSGRIVAWVFKTTSMLRKASCCWRSTRRATSWRWSMPSVRWKWRKPPWASPRQRLSPVKRCSRQRQSEERRRRTLKERLAISGEEWEKSSTEVAVAQAELLRNQANLGLAQANVQLAIAALTQAELDLQRTRVEAPVTWLRHQPADPSGRLCRGRWRAVGAGGQRLVLCQRLL